ncbi:MAG: SDR family NAD(P)-dependent oxidoreductase [Planctomycetota bacterium]
MAGTGGCGRWLVTGASRGIGRAIALELARRGAATTLVARDAAALAGVAAEVEALGGSAVTRPTDLSDPLDRAALLAELASAPPFEGLVNNAGAGLHGAFASADPAAQVRLLELDVLAPVLLARAVLPAMAAAGRGHLVTMASVAAWAPTPDEALYGAAKAALASLDGALRVELRRAGVSVTTVAPGLTRTEFFDRAGFDPAAHELGGLVWSTPEEVARAAVAGALRGRRRVVPGGRNRILGVLLRHLPLGFPRFVGRRLMKARR